MTEAAGPGKTRTLPSPPQSPTAKSRSTADSNASRCSGGKLLTEQKESNWSKEDVDFFIVFFLDPDPSAISGHVLIVDPYSFSSFHSNAKRPPPPTIQINGKDSSSSSFLFFRPHYIRRRDKAAMPGNIIGQRFIYLYFAAAGERSWRLITSSPYHLNWLGSRSRSAGAVVTQKVW